MPFEFAKTVQIGAAVLGIPAAAAGTYSAYQTYFTNDAVCQRLRASILTVMEKNVTPDAKRTLLRKDVGEFDKKCGAADPDARTIFLAAVREGEPATLIDWMLAEAGLTCVVPPCRSCSRTTFPPYESLATNAT